MAALTQAKCGDITTGPDGTGTEVWRQGSGAYGNGAGPLTDEPIDVGACCGGTSLYISMRTMSGEMAGMVELIQLRDAAGGGGILLASNGGTTPNGFGGAGGGGGWDFPPPATGELESSEVLPTPVSCVSNTRSWGRCNSYCIYNGNNCLGSSNVSSRFWL